MKFNFLSLLKFTKLTAGFFLLAPLIPQALARQNCIDLFTLAEVHSPQFEPVLQSEPTVAQRAFFEIRDVFKNDRVSDIDVGVIHRAIIQIAEARPSPPEVKSYLRELNSLIEDHRPPSHPALVDQVGEYLAQVRFLLSLLDTNLVSWEAILTTPRALERLGEFNTHGTMGILLQLLPSKTRRELLHNLGASYSGRKQHKVVHAIHVLLDGKFMYSEYKAGGRSDREFYNDYLELVKMFAFPKSEVGGYSGDFVIGIAKTLQSVIKGGKVDPKIKAVNFFGSVPNGFGQLQSDLDIYNHPIERDYPELVSQPRTAISAEDPFEVLRFQITDKVLMEATDKYLAQSRWQWRSEGDSQSPHEHFGGVHHVFSYHITPTRIELRFYPNSIRQDRWGNRLDPRHYIVLNID